jgi:hypothetical protein
MPDQPDSSSRNRDPPKDFAAHADYATLMLGARRKAAPHIGAPAINRHLGFWIPDALALARETWIKHIEVCFVGLYRHLAGLSKVSKVSRVSTPSRQRKDNSKPRLYLIHHSYAIEEGELAGEPIKGAEDVPTRHQRFLLSFVWQSMPVSLVLELFDEYFTLSTTIDLAGCPEASNTDLQKGVEVFNGHASKRYFRGGCDDAAAGAPEASEFTGAFDIIFNTVWQNLYQDIFAVPFAAHDETLGKVFAEFRGFVACRGDSKFIITNGTAEQPLEKEIGNKRFEGSDAVCCVDAIRPFMEADAWLEYDKDDKDDKGDKGERDDDNILEPREFTFTPVLDARYIYASALGAPPFPLRDGHLRLTYMLLAANHCPSELGLLVDGFHVLGTTRLAALYDFPHVTHAALELRELEGKINALLRGMMEGTNADDVAAADDQLTKKGDQLTKKLSDYSQCLAEIEQGIYARDGDRRPQIVGGLPFRVERSHYYQRQFRTLVRGLRIGRIQGFLTYDEAVTRRLGGIYDLIDTVGIRHERLCETLAGLSRRVQAARAHELQQTIKEGTQQILVLHGQIAELTGEIDADQKAVAAEQKILENVLRNSQNTQMEVMLIQLFGEALLTIFLVPYYVVSLLLHGLTCQLHEWCAETAAWPGVININLELTITATVFVLCLIIGVARVVKNLRKIQKTPK